MKHKFNRSRDFYITKKNNGFISNFIDDTLEGIQDFLDLITDNSTALIWVVIICLIAYLYKKKRR